MPYVCGSNCKIGTCTGDSSCHSCLDGYMGSNCETKCDAAHHGENCAIACEF